MAACFTASCIDDAAEKYELNLQHTLLRKFIAARNYSIISYIKQKLVEFRCFGLRASMLHILTYFCAAFFIMCSNLLVRMSR